MTRKQLKENWPTYAVMIIANVAILFFISCPPQTKSIMHPDKKVTRVELQLELDVFIATAQVRMADLDKQDQLRDIILKNALVMVETGAFSPVGLFSALFACYGVAKTVTGTKNAIKKFKST